MLFAKKDRWLIAGLGNPGPKYQNTRHNAGFLAIDNLCQDFGASNLRNRKNAEVYKANFKDKELIFIKPLTFMNASGAAVSEVSKYYRIPIENIIIICDDVTLDAGKIRIRPKGSDGGHNGLWDIIKALDTEQFKRIKLGVGKKPCPDYDLVDWVLGNFSKEARALLDSAIEKVPDIVKLLVENKLSEAQNKFNG